MGGGGELERARVLTFLLVRPDAGKGRDPREEHAQRGGRRRGGTLCLARASSDRKLEEGVFQEGDKKKVPTYPYRLLRRQQKKKCLREGE